MRDLLQVTEYDNYDIYTLGKTHIAFSRGHAPIADVMVKLWDGEECVFPDVPDIKKPGWKVLFLFNVGPADGDPENGWIWNEYEMLVNKKIKEVYEYIQSKAQQNKQVITNGNARTINIDLQREEAARRMSVLGIPEQIAKSSETYMSYKSAFMLIDQSLLNMIKDFEKRTDNIVYHVIQDKIGRGEYKCDLLYISPNQSEWDKELVVTGEDSFIIRVLTVRLSVVKAEDEEVSIEANISANAAHKLGSFFYGEDRMINYKEYTKTIKIPR